MRPYTPQYVVFCGQGNLIGDVDPYQDSGLEVSPTLLIEWLRFYNYKPRVALHFPLRGDALLYSMNMLGLPSSHLSIGLFSYMKALKKVIDFKEFYVPYVMLHALTVEFKLRRARIPSKELVREIKGAKLAPTPLNKWSLWEKDPVTGQEGYLTYASVYDSKDISHQWSETVHVAGPPPTEVRTIVPFKDIDDWLKTARSNGIRVVPVVAASEGPRALVEALAWQESAEPRGLVYQNVPLATGGSPRPPLSVPAEWWELSQSGQLRLEDGL